MKLLSLTKLVFKSHKNVLFLKFIVNDYLKIKPYTDATYDQQTKLNSLAII